MQTTAAAPTALAVPETSPETALALRQVSAPAGPYEPQTYEQAKALAKDFAASKLTKCRTPEQAILVMATGRELGIPATTALRMIYVADFGQGDQATLSADLMVALCLRQRSLCTYFRCTESSDERATYETQRAGDPPRSITFTEADRVKAKLGFSKDGTQSPDSNWAKYRATMLKHRAASLLAREVYPDIVGGFYTPDEAQEVAQGEQVRVVAAPVSPLTPAKAAPAPEAVVDAEFTESKPDPRLAELLAKVGGAGSAAELAKVAAEITKVFPDQGSPERTQLRAAIAARKASNYGAGEPAHDPATGEVKAQREPGEEG